MNLLTDDSIWFTMLQEAIHVQLPRALRRMFSQMLLFCEIENPLALWEQFKYHLSEDYIRRLNDNDLAYNYALAYINRYLALQDDESDSDPFSAVDSDLDPMFLPSSNDELSDSSDISLTEIIGQKKKFTKTTGERPEQVYNFENQPCCSKSLPVAEFQEAGVQNEDGTQNLNVSSTETGDNLENVLDEEEAADQNEHTWREPIPYNYVWKITQTRIWVERQRHFNRIIPRLYFVHPRGGERFYLRQRLLHKTGCRSFEDISTVHGRTYETFRDAAIAMNLLTDDSIWFTMLQEVIHVQLPRALRRMFSQMLLFCEIENPLALWEQFKYHLSEDYIRRLNDNDLAYNYALAYINRYLAVQGKSNRDFQLLLPTEPVEHLIEDEYDYDQSEEQEIANRNIPLLNQEQRRIFTDILLAVNENERVSHRLFFIKGIGGAGKTFLLNTLLTYLLGNNHRYISICYTGIPASLLKNGQTIHPAFMLPVPILENSTSRIRNQSAIADNIRYSKIIVIDEISMVHKSIFNEIGRKIREIMNNDIPLGGKIIIILGDFRQCAPIVPLAGKNETISASVKCSQLWQHFVKYDLLTNVRALPQQNEFKDWLMTIGNNSEILRHLENGRDTIVKVPNHIIVENVTESIYGSNLIEHDFR
ncbi:unnamed protein product [Acanthoscelides obtectus]|uniref:ATP-dependent DNA helicase n=1 Tax=Acanthoscelides obtectus TaxID=200917 RepID=A0A9P0QDL5_ACAOB|nr:unnamed protein product [Acanthoscelides obtectus]